MAASRDLVVRIPARHVELWELVFDEALKCAADVCNLDPADVSTVQVFDEILPTLAREYLEPTLRREADDTSAGAVQTERSRRDNGH